MVVVAVLWGEVSWRTTSHTLRLRSSEVVVMRPSDGWKVRENMEPWKKNGDVDVGV